MDETTTAALPPESVPAAGPLAAALGIEPAALADALLAALNRLGVLVSIKEVASGRYLHLNAAMAEAIGRPAAEVLGTTDAGWLEPAQAATLRAAEQTALTQTVATSAEHRLERAGRRRHFGVTRLPVPGQGGRPARHVLSVWLDETDDRQQRQQLQQAIAQLEQQQNALEALRVEATASQPRDLATGLYRSAHFDDQLRREIDLSSREHREFALVTIALDPPSVSVEALGPQLRVRVLEALGRLLRGNTRAMDASCRLNEERFVILLSGVGLATAHSRMEGLRRQCATQIVVLGGRELGFTVSMGVASFPHTAHTEEALLQSSAAALSEARRRGGNHVALASIRFETPAQA